MARKKKDSLKNKDKPKVSLIFNKVFEEYRKKQKIKEKREIKLREEILKKELIKIKLKEKDQKIIEEEQRKVLINT